MSEFLIRPEASSDAVAVNQMINTIFGPAMYARAAYALREGIAPEAPLCFVAETKDGLIGVVRQTRIQIGTKPALMLGPLGVLNHVNGKGVGSALMEKSMTSARQEYLPQGIDAVILVGDLSYYKSFGFQTVAMAKITLPRPADPSRILICNLQDEECAGYSGAARKWEV
ncbi:MAG: GNAT family N-acetyltransferase [Hyphomicrobiales bacterium]|nr:MAG: GNAT family N-acetyltransferase [Hyphomicrobiales bacterium]